MGGQFIYPLFRLSPDRVRLTAEFRGGIVAGIGFGLAAGTWMQTRAGDWWPVVSVLVIAPILLAIGAGVARRAQSVSRRASESPA